VHTKGTIARDITQGDVFHVEMREAPLQTDITQGDVFHLEAEAVAE